MISRHKAWKRPARTCEDATKIDRLAKRYEQALALAINDEPLPIDPRQIGISKINRLFNINQVHNVILRSVITDGHDPTRPDIGICVEYTDPQKRKDLVDYNRELTLLSPLMPPLHEDLMRYEALACTHYNTSLRLGRECCHSPAGDLSALRKKDASWEESSDIGHLWIVLPENIEPSLKVDIATWRNQDQNENQSITDGEMLRLASITVKEFRTLTRSLCPVNMPLAEIVKNTCVKTPLRLNPTVVGGYARWVCQIISEKETGLLDQFLNFWTVEVDCKNLAVSHNFFDAMAKSPVLQGKPHFRVALAMSMYTSDGALPKTRPTPDQCNLITASELTAMEKMPFVAELVETTLERATKDWLPLMKAAQVHTRNQFYLQLRTLIVRAAFGKPLKVPGIEVTTISTGRWTVEKMNKLLGAWAKHVDTVLPALDFSNTSELKSFYVEGTPLVSDEVFEVQPTTNIRITTKTTTANTVAAPGSGPGGGAVPTGAPEAASASSGSLAVGTPAKLNARITLVMPLDDDPDFRKDLKKGARVEILEIQDNKAKIKANIKWHNEPKIIEDWINMKHLVAEESQEPPQPIENGVPDCIANAPHATGGSAQCECVEDWESDLIEDDTDLVSLNFLKGQTSMVMQLVLDQMPTLGEKDLYVIHRTNSNGIKHTEIWTRKDFEKNELRFCPVTSEMKIRMYTHNTCVHVKMPEDAVPENKVFALDGRGKTHLSQADPHNHVPKTTGSLFWAIERTSTAKDANLSLAWTSVQIPEVRIQVPGEKATKKSFGKDKLPSIPILRNTRDVPANTRLLAMNDCVVVKATEEEAEKRKVERIKAEHGAPPAKKAKIG